MSANVSTTSHSSWEPTVQTHEPTGDVLHSNYNSPSAGSHSKLVAGTVPLDCIRRALDLRTRKRGSALAPNVRHFSAFLNAGKYLPAQGCQGDKGIENVDLSCFSKSFARSRPVNTTEKDLPPLAGTCCCQKRAQSLLMVSRRLPYS